MVVTLALQVIVIAVATNWKSLTGGTDGIRGVPSLHMFGYSLNNPERFLPAAILPLSVCFWIAWRLTNSPFGRALRAMRENESAVEAIGKDLLYMKVAVFAFSAGLAAVAGSLFARYLSYVGAESFGIDDDSGHQGEKQSGSAEAVRHISQAGNHRRNKRRQRQSRQARGFFGRL